MVSSNLGTVFGPNLLRPDVSYIVHVLLCVVYVCVTCVCGHYKYVQYINDKNIGHLLLPMADRLGFATHKHVSAR